MKPFWTIVLVSLLPTACADDPETPSNGGATDPPTLSSTLVLNSCGQLSGVTATATIAASSNSAAITPESLSIEGGTGAMTFDNASVASGTSVSFECHNGVSFDTAPADGASVAVTLTYRNADTTLGTVTSSASVSTMVASDNCDTAFETDIVACAVRSN